MKMKILSSVIAVGIASTAFGQYATDPVGVVSVTVPAQSDAILAVPLNRTAEVKGLIQSISGNTITVAGTLNWSLNQFVQSLPGQTKTYAVLIASGAKEGMVCKVTSNGTNTLTVVVDGGDNLTGIGTVTVPVDPDGAGPLTSQADQIDVVPYWTPASVMTSPVDGTEIYTYFNTTGDPKSGTNVSPSDLIAYDATVSKWVNQTTEDDVSNMPLKFGSAFLLRNNSAIQTIALVGAVPMTSHRFLLRTLGSSVDQDIRLGYSSPVPETVAGLGIPALEGDQIFLYNNAAAGKNKAPSKILVYSGEWLNSQTELPEGTQQIQPGTGFVYRKFRTGTPQVAVWQDVQSYLTTP